MLGIMYVLALGLPGQAQDKTDKTDKTKPAPDVIVFTNGDQLTGTLERGVGDSILFKSDVAGELTLPMSKIKEMHSTGSFALLRKSSPVSRGSIETGTLFVSGGSITIAHTIAPPETVPVSDIAYLVDQTTYDRDLEKQPSLLYGWNGSMTAGASFVRSTSNGSTFNGAIGLVRAIPTVPWLPARDRTSFDMAETYGKTTQPVIPPTSPPSPNVVTETNIFHSDAERDQYFTSRVYALGQMAFDHNFAQGLQLAQSYGGGIGWTIVKQAQQELDVKGDLHFLQQEFQTAASNQNLVGSNFAEVYTRKLPRKIIFHQNASFIPAWNNLNAYAANLNATLLLPVWRRFGLSVTTADSFLNDPPPFYKKNSFVFTTGLTYTLK
jgi:hypothetical protein